MKNFRPSFAIAAMALSLSCLCAAQTTSTYHGRTITIPESNTPHAGKIHTNYFLMGTGERTPQPPPDAETPGSLGCVYELVSGPSGCPIATSTNIPTGGIGAIAIVDAGDYPTAVQDLHAFSAQFGIPDADFQVVYANGKKPPVYEEWITEEALGHRMGARYGSESKVVSAWNRTYSTPIQRGKRSLLPENWFHKTVAAWSA